LAQYMIMKKKIGGYIGHFKSSARYAYVASRMMHSL
jgi:hypothetical protein